MTQELANNTSVIQQDKGISPPYISFLTFNNMINWLETENVPIKFDRSFWGKKYAGSLGTQLMAGMRFLGLLKGDYTQPLLGEIVKAKGDERKKLLVSMIQKSYTAVDFIQLSGATPSMLKEWFAKYKNLDGSTERKARSFFVNACKAYDILLPNSIKKTARNKQTGGIHRGKKVEKEKLNPENKGGNTEQNSLSLNPPPPLEESKQQDLFKIILSDGCELKLCSDRAFFDIEKTDRTVIEDIVEVMKKYRK